MHKFFSGKVKLFPIFTVTLIVVEVVDTFWDIWSGGFVSAVSVYRIFSVVWMIIALKLWLLINDAVEDARNTIGELRKELDDAKKDLNNTKQGAIGLPQILDPEDIPLPIRIMLGRMGDGKDKGTIN